MTCSFHNYCVHQAVAQLHITHLPFKAEFKSWIVDRSGRFDTEFEDEGAVADMIVLRAITGGTGMLNFRTLDGQNGLTMSMPMA